MLKNAPGVRISFSAVDVHSIQSRRPKDKELPSGSKNVSRYNLSPNTLNTLASMPSS
jgi:hypothetical protein